ncbi:MAG: metal-dependent transcriptional regulator [Candidatus Nanohalobium sp.]
MKSREDYLRAIYELGDEEGTTTSELAEHLDVSDASASEAIQKLEEDNLVCRAPYRGFTLSPIGKAEAQKVARKHQVLREFLEKTLEVEKAEEQADAIEHSITEETAEKIKELNQG